MDKKAVIVAGLGPGDDGKGGVVQAVASALDAHTIIKVGGAQGSHGVCTSRGERAAFSLYGCGTFDGVRTHISSNMVISPEGVLNETDMLRYEHGIDDPLSLLTVDEDALCAHAIHGVASRLKELGRGVDPRGTIGTGVGEAYRYSVSDPETAIRVRDLSHPDLRDLIVAQRDRIAHDLEPVIREGFLFEDRNAAGEEIALLRNDRLIDHLVDRFREMARNVKIVDHGYLGREILAQDGNVVVESSHGVLTDHYQGFFPHVSAIRTLPSFNRAMLEEAGYDGRIVQLGVTRAYAFRHGAGPMPTAEEILLQDMLPGSHKEENRWQGKVRAGALDLPLLRYSIACCGGPSAFNGLAVTWFDQIVRNGEWKLCDRYAEAKDPDFFTPTGEIKVRLGEDQGQLDRQEKLGKLLRQVQPLQHSVLIRQDKTQEQLGEFCAETLEESLKVPVKLISFGPTELDKLYR